MWRGQYGSLQPSTCREVRLRDYSFLSDNDILLDLLQVQRRRGKNNDCELALSRFCTHHSFRSYRDRSTRVTGNGVWYGFVEEGFRRGSKNRAFAQECTDGAFE